ncbi:hypothetical protein VE02_01453 [Pseudogymnoascus sp. 03VT05]|nr:hypothetical protein VE02_01453 [Pseudogymnoascus sp. 03VT05]
MSPVLNTDFVNFNEIPVNGITHLYFSFGYITPGDFNVAPKDDQDPDLFRQMTALKSKNPGLKCIVALGGWTFNDPGATQTVYSDMVSTQANRAKFIVNLFAFMREYAFDGEYPGAPDRGGQVDDGVNFTQFLKELREAIGKEPIDYVSSFTVPTSYWYLRWFDLTAADHVDFINVMSYDLHGTWDSTNPIGSHVYAHTNLTEIKQAFDLFWRNSVPPNKLNLGIGFYGRSFQLSDPSCYTPGCNFLGGASPGPCTQNSGILSYKEITGIITQNNLTPYYDEENAVKYIVWNQDQWVSYDDEVTIKQKLDFANGLGLGGVLIWSVDQDTTDPKALNAVLAPKNIQAFANNAQDASYWGIVGKLAELEFLQSLISHAEGQNPLLAIRLRQIAISAAPFRVPQMLLIKTYYKVTDWILLSAKKWQSCSWHGEPGSCFDNHCDAGHQVQLATNAYGLGESCFPRLERFRVFCCDPAAGESAFLPVDLSKLFPHPPEEDNVDTDFELRVDNTWGDGIADTSDANDPDDSTFGFVVITSPEELQVSIDKRDGSDWGVFGCNDAVTKEAETIQMFCTDISEKSNCYKISLGHGVAGTILEMPKGCGPSRFAVAKSMVPAKDQTLPKRLEKRNYGFKPVIYDLTFDFEWMRVVAGGSITAHLKPTISFGIAFDEMWHVSAAGVDVIADSWMKIVAKAGISSNGNCPFTYGISVGADLYARVNAPDAFHWTPRTFPLASVPAKWAKELNACPVSQRKRGLPEIGAGSPWEAIDPPVNETVQKRDAGHKLVKRLTIGPLLTLKLQERTCPVESKPAGACGTVNGWPDDQLVEQPDTRRRSIGPLSYNNFPNTNTYGYTNPTVCNDYGFHVIGAPAITTTFGTEHILEWQLFAQFIEGMRTQLGAAFPNPTTAGGNMVDACQYINAYFYKLAAADRPTCRGVVRSPLGCVTYEYPGIPAESLFVNEFVVLTAGVNAAKRGMWSPTVINNENTVTGYLGQGMEGFQNVKDVITAYKYHRFNEINNNLLAQSNRIGAMFQQMEAHLAAAPALHQSGNVLLQPYQQANLQAQWRAFMNTKAATAKTRAELWMDNWTGQLETTYCSNYQLGFAQDRTTELRQATGDPNILSDEQIFIDKITRLRQEVNSRPS